MGGLGSARRTARAQRAQPRSPVVPRLSGLSSVALAGVLLAGVAGGVPGAASASTASSALQASSVATDTGTVLGSLRLPVPAGAVVVAPGGSDTAAGTATAPLATLGRAVAVVPDGGTVVLRAGSYRENVRVYGKTVHLQNWPGEAAWLDGSRPVSGWTADGGAWRAQGYSEEFDTRDYSGLQVTAADPQARYPDEVFVDGRQLDQVLSRAALRPGTFFVDAAADRLWLADDPRGRDVAAATLEEALYLQEGADDRGEGSSVRGIGVRRYATPINRFGAVKVYADRGVVSDLVVEDCAQAGLSLKGRGLRVRDSLLARNGQLGLHANNSDDLVLDRLRVSGNNRERFATNHAAGGLKITMSRDVRVRDSLVDGNLGSGLWLDESVVRTTVTGSAFRGNARHGVIFELSAGLVFAGNVASGNAEAGLRVLEAGHAAVWHNVFDGNGRNVDLMDGDRVAAVDSGQRGYDKRYPYPDPYVSWEVEDVVVRGNVLADGDGARKPLLGSDDARRTGDPRRRGSSSDANLFVHGGALRWVANWRVDADMVASPTLADFSRRTGLETSSVEVSSGARDLARAPLAPPLPTDVAAALGQSAGARLVAGLPPATAPLQTTPPAVDDVFLRPVHVVRPLTG